MRHLDPETLDPGIRPVVEALRACGWDTCSSGDGQREAVRLLAPPSRHAAPGRPYDLPFPHVVVVDAGEKVDVPRSALAILAVVNVTDKRNGWVVEASYSTDDGVLVFVASCPTAAVLLPWPGAAR